MARGKRKTPRYVYIDRRLHKVLSVNRQADFVTAWDYTEHRVKGYVWSDVRRRMERAYTIAQAAQLLNRHRNRIVVNLREGNLRYPQRVYNLETRKPGKYMFSETDVLELHDFFVTVHRGRPRKDGAVTPQMMPTRAELRALMQHDTMMYVKDENDQFIPVWKEQIW